MLNKIQLCKKCENDAHINEFITFNKPKSFYGSDSPSVLLIGHSPAVRSSEEADVVLKLDKPEQPLYKYITQEILGHLNINISQIYATNLLKCKTTQLPEELDGSSDFIGTCFSNCTSLLEEEIATINPRLIISLSEKVLKFLSGKYMGKKLTMKESFGKLFFLSINGKSFPYIPVVHIHKGANTPFDKYYFPAQTERLSQIENKIDHFSYLNSRLMEIQSQQWKKLKCSELLSLPEEGGVYLISLKEGNVPLYVGRTKNLKNRLVQGHINGLEQSARLKKYLVAAKVVKDVVEAKGYLENKCVVQWILENEYRKRGAIEGFLTGILFPRYGIYEEH